MNISLANIFASCRRTWEWLALFREWLSRFGGVRTNCHPSAHDVVTSVTQFGGHDLQYSVAAVSVGPNPERLSGDLRQDGFGFLFGEVLRFVRMIHRAKLGTAHGAERRVFEALLGQGFIVVSAGGFGIER